MNSGISRRNLVLFSLVVAIATPISVLSYQYSLSTSRQIEEISVGDIRSNADIQAHDIANSLSNKLADSVNIIEIIAGSPAIMQDDLERAKQLLDRAQESTAELVDFYMWLDRDGRMLWVSNINQTAQQQFANIDLSYRLYFSVPQETHQPYYSSVVESNDQVNRLYISHPILDRGSGDPETDQFDGIIVAAIRTDTLGAFLENQLSPNLESEVGLLDNTGIILYHAEEEYVGKNAFGVRFQSNLAAIDLELLRSMNNGLDDALAGHSGLQDIPVADDDTATFAYKPIVLEGKQFGVLYILAPHTFAIDVAPLVEQQKNLSVALIIVVSGAALGAILIIFTWNKRLEETVKSRTTELSSANEQLMTHDKLQKEFINIAAHELRTPVQPLLGVAEMLEHQFDDGKRKEITITKPEVDMLLRNARRLLNLSSGLLEVSRIESNTLKLAKEPLDIKVKIETVVHDMQSILSPERNLKLRMENTAGPSHEPLLVNADRERIFEVISNLLANAIKFTPDGEIVIMLERGDENSIIVNIKDSGRGIDQDILPRLFTKFATNSETGTGLGLFISKSIIEAHGGKIWAKNNEGKRGATFSFSLPLIQSAKIE
ncbi:MAG TPA: sensor histidine kinase [Nitrososphaera sp.]|nr:sensor histidine kinase [Nitrososphaera sp.]